MSRVAPAAHSRQPQPPAHQSSPASSARQLAKMRSRPAAYEYLRLERVKRPRTLAKCGYTAITDMKYMT